MKLAVSNIAWEENLDEIIFDKMEQHGFQSLEIAPTRILPKSPYDHLEKAVAFQKKLQQDYGFSICSMQSIWFGRTESLFGSELEREALLSYTKKAIDFSSAIRCKNLVFGCPKNRCIPPKVDIKIAISFFREIAAYAKNKECVIGIEPNPPIYNTNFINTTSEALNLIKKVDSPNFLLNLDLGAMIENGESIESLRDVVPLISHVHISEPFLKTIQPRPLHKGLKHILESNGYLGCVSIEMGKSEGIEQLIKTIEYVAATFGS